MSNDVNADFAQLHQTSQIGAAGFDMSRTHPLFAATHSVILASKYGKEDPYTYMKHPGLRAMDTRAAALESLQSAGSGLRRYADMYRPSVPGPVPDMSSTGTATNGQAAPAPTPHPSTWIG